MQYVQYLDGSRVGLLEVVLMGLQTVSSQSDGELGPRLLDWTGRDWDWIGLCWTVLCCIVLYYTILDCAVDPTIP